jgi:hypothetical protein
MNEPAPDPDPTPTASPWVEYLAAAQSLDAVRRDAANAAAAATLAASAARAELAQVSTQLELQRARLMGAATQAGLPAAPLTPSPAEQATADAILAGDPASVPDALRRCQRLLETADAELVDSTTDDRGWWPPPLWVWIVGALGAAAALACAIPLLLILLGS